MKEFYTALLRQQLKLEDSKKKALELQEIIDKNQENVEALTTAREVFQAAALRAQELLEIKISKIVTTALDIVDFPEGYEFVAKFVVRRNTTECDLLFKRGDHTLEPLDSCGYGAADVASFALRVAYWYIYSQVNPIRPVIICDEPFSNLDADKQPAAMEILQVLSREFGLQFIITTHVNVFRENADKVFYVHMDNGKSIVSEVRQN